MKAKRKKQIQFTPLAQSILKREELSKELLTVNLMIEECQEVLGTCGNIGKNVEKIKKQNLFINVLWNDVINTELESLDECDERDPGYLFSLETKIDLLMECLEKVQRKVVNIADEKIALSDIKKAISQKEDLTKQLAAILPTE